MTEQKRNEIVSRFRAGASIRRIARDLGLARNTVSGVLAEVQSQRAGTDAAMPSRRRSRQLDHYEPVLQELLGRYPDLTAMRLLEELRQRGFSGGYTVVRQRLRELRPKTVPAPVIRFETALGAPGADGLRRLRHRLHERRPAPRLPVQLYSGLLAPAVPPLRREPGLRHDRA